MSQFTLSVLFFSIYIILLFILSWYGSKKTTDLKSFSLGNGDVNPYLNAIVFSAAFASSGTFVSFSGHTYNSGYSGLWFGMCQWVPAILGLAILAKGYKRIGSRLKSLSVADWIGARYNSSKYGNFIAMTCLLMVFQIASQVAGCAVIMKTMFNTSYQTGVIITLVVLMSYVTLGGTFAHIYTNVLQGSIMLIISVVVFLSIFVISGGNPPVFLTEHLSRFGPEYTAFMNPKTAAFGSVPALVGLFLAHFMWIANPHTINKFQYIKKDRDLKKFLVMSAICIFCFNLVAQAGLGARIFDINSTLPTVDDAITLYISSVFPLFVSTFFCIAILAACMASADGIIVFLSTLIGNTFYLNMYAKNQIDNGLLSQERAEKKAFKVAQVGVILVCLCALPIAWNQPAFITTLIWIGSGGILSAISGPILLGIYYKKSTTAAAAISSVVGLTSFILLYLLNLTPSIYVAVACGGFINIASMFILCQFTTPMDQKYVDMIFENRGLVQK